MLGGFSPGSPQDPPQDSHPGPSRTGGAGGAGGTGGASDTPHRFRSSGFCLETNWRLWRAAAATCLGVSVSVVAPRGDPQRFWVDSGLILGRFWEDSGSILECFWVDFGSILGRFWVDSSGVICVSAALPRASGFLRRALGSTERVCPKLQALALSRRHLFGDNIFAHPRAGRPVAVR